MKVQKVEEVRDFLKTKESAMEMIAHVLFLFVASLSKVSLETSTYQAKTSFKLEKVALENVTQSGAFLVGYYRCFEWKHNNFDTPCAEWLSPILIANVFVTPETSLPTPLEEFSF